MGVSDGSRMGVGWESDRSGLPRFSSHRSGFPWVDTQFRGHQKSTYGCYIVCLILHTYWVS